MTDRITIPEFEHAEGTQDWRVLGDGATATFRTTSLAQSARLVAAIAALPGADDHPPDLDIRPIGVTARLVTFVGGYGGLTTADRELARRISAVARDHGAAADPSAVQSLLAIVGSQANAGVLPFWQAVLGYLPRPDSPEEDLVDPSGRWPGIWFEEMRQLRADGGGSIHLAVFVPSEQAEARVAAAVAAGGRIVRDDQAPTWWTLADTAGNECDVATTDGR